MPRRILIGLVIGALAAVTVAPAISVATYPSKGDVTITTAKVDRAGNAIIDFQLTCDVAMRVEAWGVQVDQSTRKGAKAYGSVGNVQAGYFCMPGSPMSPHDGDQFVENGALFIRPGWDSTERGSVPSAPYAPGYATVAINIYGWEQCPLQTTWDDCNTWIDNHPGGMYDAFWSYQTVKLVRTR